MVVSRPAIARAHHLDLHGSPVAAFVLNKVGARHINIAHGLYPRQQLTEKAQAYLIRFLRTNISQRSGRTYAGGLTKFEPREMERLVVPSPEMLDAGIAQ